MLVSSWYRIAMATSVASEPTVNLTLRLPRSLHATAAEMAARDDRTLNNLVVHLLRREAERDDWQKLDEAIAAANRGEVFPLTLEMTARLRHEIEQGTDADEALARAAF